MSGRRITPRLAQYIRELASQGYSARAIGREVGTSDKTVGRVLSGRWHPDPRSRLHATRKLLPEHVREIRELCACGARHHDVAERYGVTRSTISAAMRGTTYGWVM